MNRYRLEKIEKAARAAVEAYGVWYHSDDGSDLDPVTAAMENLRRILNASEASFRKEKA